MGTPRYRRSVPLTPEHRPELPGLIPTGNVR